MIFFDFSRNFRLKTINKFNKLTLQKKTCIFAVILCILKLFHKFVKLSQNTLKILKKITNFKYIL